jgi:hypothetical protein
LYNALYDLNVDLAMEVNGTNADPFNDDSNVENFWNFINHHSR